MRKTGYGLVTLVSAALLVAGYGCGVVQEPEDASPATPVAAEAEALQGCGDGYCYGNMGETCSNCPADCCPSTVCGNGICSGYETCSTCPADCGACCGGTNQACCGGTNCASGNVCVNGTCRHCGNTGEPCCTSGSACAASNNCVSGTCRHCGYNGEACCTTGTACSGILYCSGGTCRAPACGSLGQPCCQGACIAGQGQCYLGYCTLCGNYGQPCCYGYQCNGPYSCSMWGTCQF